MQIKVPSLYYSGCGASVTGSGDKAEILERLYFF